MASFIPNRPITRPTYETVTDEFYFTAAIGPSAVPRIGARRRSRSGLVRSISALGAKRKPRSFEQGNGDSDRRGNPAHDRRKPFSGGWPNRSRDHHQRDHSGALDTVARRTERPARRREPAGRRYIDPLAWLARSLPDGWRPGGQLSGHSGPFDLRLRIPGPSVRHLLVSQPFGPSGAGRSLWPDDHRSGRRRSRRLRSRACDRAVRLELPPPAPDLLAPQAGRRLLQSSEGNPVRPA